MLSIIAGFLIGMGGIIYLTLGGIAGALFFSLGLITIVFGTAKSATHAGIKVIFNHQFSPPLRYNLVQCVAREGGLEL